MTNPVSPPFLRALPVGQGDAFLYRPDPEHAALVDGGRSKRQIAGLLRAYEVNHIDVALCSHNDADHSHGIIGLLEEVSVGEVWLPGSWTDRLADLLRSPRAVWRELNKDIESEDLSGIADLGALGDRYSEDDAAIEEEGEGPPIAEVLANALGSLPPDLGPWPAPWLWRYPPDVDLTALGIQERILLEALDAAAKIRAIASRAWHAGVPIRWFDFKSAKKAGTASMIQPSFLEPVNAKEIVRVTRRRPRILRALALTRSNRESLVMFAPSTGDCGVLFTADSDLGFSPPLSLPQRAHLLVTAPHHGSNDNAAAYTRLSSQSGTRTWVRSDGRYASRPGACFLAARGQQALCYCTICRNHGAPKQAVTLTAQPGGWASQSRPCQCT